MIRLTCLFFPSSTCEWLTDACTIAVARWDLVFVFEMSFKARDFRERTLPAIVSSSWSITKLWVDRRLERSKGQLWIQSSGLSGFMIVMNSIRLSNVPPLHSPIADLSNWSRYFRVLKKSKWEVFQQQTMSYHITYCRVCKYIFSVNWMPTRCALFKQLQIASLSTFWLLTLEVTSTRTDILTERSSDDAI